MKSFNQFKSTEEITNIQEQRLIAIQQSLNESGAAALVTRAATALKGIGSLGGKAKNLFGRGRDLAMRYPTTAGFLGAGGYQAARAGIGFFGRQAGLDASQYQQMMDKIRDQNQELQSRSRRRKGEEGGGEGGEPIEGSGYGYAGIDTLRKGRSR